MSRGRGFSGRGSSFRGRGGGDDSGSWGNESRGRGGFSGSRGRGFWYKDSSFDSRSRYASGVSDRYSSRGRGDDSSYRRYSRVDGPGYSTRDHSHHRSPESQRKRMRTDHGYVQASSSRRSHEGSYGGGNDYSNRYGYSEEKGGYGDERGRYREERRSASSFRDRSREDYAHRKAEQLDSSMPPPSSAPTRHLSSPRGSFRGRVSRGTRGLSRMIFSRRSDSLLIRKKGLMESSYIFRKRLLARTQAENLRRLKLQKLRRLREAALSKKEGSEKEGNKTTEDISDDDEKEGNWEDDAEKVEGEEEELEEGETPDKKEKKSKKKKEAKTGKDDEREEGEEVDDDEEDDDDAGSGSKKSESKNEAGVHVTIKQDSDARAVSEEGHKRLPRSTIGGRPYIRLTCPHCYVRCITFKEYTMHLYTSKHTNMMRKQSLRLKHTLARMRMNQRQKQRVVEDSEEVHGSLQARSNFCPICKLNYRQLKSKHQASESHRAMKRFLMPYCRICRIGFKSPMLYENHICSIEHLKRKARLEERMVRLQDRDREDNDGSGMDDDKELNMDNFMILDSVGSADDTGDEEGEDGKSKSDKEKKETKDKKKKEINLGSEYVKKVEVLFCELCRIYLPRLDQPERALSIHCRTRNHLQRYVRYRDDRALRSRAEKIHRKERAKENAAKEAEAKKNLEEKSEDHDEKKDDEVSSSNEKEASGKDSADATGTESKKGNEGSGKASKHDSGGHDTSETRDGGAEDMDQDLEGGMDDKLWADVDKDLGDLLREVEPGNKSSDEDDDSRAEGGRYDRFRYSEKGSVATTDPPSEGDATKTITETDEAVTKSDAAGKGTKESANAKPADEMKQIVNDIPVAAESN